jgi:transcription elongation factor Elf1
MNQNNHSCKICGTEYYFCDYCGQQTSFTPYKSVCCSIECYSKYMDAVLAARGELEPVTVQTATPVVEEVDEVISETVSEVTFDEVPESTYTKSKRK